MSRADPKEPARASTPRTTSTRQQVRTISAAIDRCLVQEEAAETPEQSDLWRCQREALEIVLDLPRRCGGMADDRARP
jgi:hypothetical protein